MSREHFIKYNTATGAEISRSSVPQGEAAIQYLAPGEAIVILPPEGLPPGQPADIEAVRRSLWNKTRAKREVAIAAGAETPFGTFDTDRDSLTNIFRSVTAATAAISVGQPFSVEWTLKDNTTATLDAVQMIDAGLAVFDHINNARHAADDLRGALSAAPDLTALLKIDVEAPWSP